MHQKAVALLMRQSNVVRIKDMEIFILSALFKYLALSTLYK